MNKQFIPRLQESEGHTRLKPSELCECPFAQFKRWYAEALAKETTTEPNCMTIATATTDGKPSIRNMLLKYYDHEKFIFFTNYNSRKARELNDNPRIAALFYWPTMDLQVRIEGEVIRCGEEVQP